MLIIICSFIVVSILFLCLTIFIRDKLENDDDDGGDGDGDEM
ncbi:hypothetical protein [Borrelia crocidurae]|uniref:Uncharacterized protein n=1 Tax=Borrelia crocidurae (strain Achema) TaxID=1155096 RepID=I0FER0_BORCA|nr:hypothetical protein [Borrelia crocidurae]AFI31966.1 hypothetical protein Q7M_1209 [Borrelia crocidurae str. Achema]